MVTFLSFIFVAVKSPETVSKYSDLVLLSAISTGKRIRCQWLEPAAAAARAAAAAAAAACMHACCTGRCPTVRWLLNLSPRLALQTGRKKPAGVHCMAPGCTKFYYKDSTVHYHRLPLNNKPLWSNGSRRWNWKTRLWISTRRCVGLIFGWRLHQKKAVFMMEYSPRRKHPDSSTQLSPPCLTFLSTKLGIRMLHAVFEWNV